jgi:hypothetical protein
MQWRKLIPRVKDALKDYNVSILYVPLTTESSSNYEAFLNLNGATIRKGVQLPVNNT